MDNSTVMKMNNNSSINCYENYDFMTFWTVWYDCVNECETLIRLA